MKRLIASIVTAASLLPAAMPVALAAYTSPIFIVDLCKVSVTDLDVGQTFNRVTNCKPGRQFKAPMITSKLCADRYVIKNAVNADVTASYKALYC